jgi:colanic acid biosynthesis glycosyl transferase WcaI
VRIAILTHFYDPEACAAATRIRTLANALVRSGHNVTIVTNFPSFPVGRTAPGDTMRVLRKEGPPAKRIVRLFTLTFHGLPLARLWHWMVSAIAASVYLIGTRQRFDTIICSIPPITLAMPALLGAFRHRARLIVDVRDVYPDIAVAMGEWPANGFFARVCEFIVRGLYPRAALIVGVTPTAIRQIASRGVDTRRLLLAPNGCERWDHLRHECGDRFVALYAGNLGVATDVDLLVDAAAQVSADGIEIHIAGDGAQGLRMRQRVRERALTNVRFIGTVSRDRAMSLLAKADVCVVPLRPGIHESVPTKIYDALSAGCPVVVAADGEARRVTEESGGGVCVKPGDALALSEALRRLAGSDRAELHALGERGKRFVQRYYEREAIMDELSSRIAAL